MTGRVIINAAYPFVPYELSTAHLASTYLPADIQSRFLERFGYDTSLVSATDVQGFQAQWRIATSDRDSEVLLQEYHQGYRNLFESFNISFDRYLRTDAPDVREAAVDAFQGLVDSDLVFEADRTVFRCEDCETYLPARYRVETADGIRCERCDSIDVRTESRPHLFINLPKTNCFRPVVKNQHWKEVQEQLQAESADLEPWNITRDDYLGFDIPDREINQSLYLWFSSLVTDFVLAGSEGRVAILNGEPVKYCHHIGKNITYFQGIVSPVVLKKGLGVPDFSSDGLDIQLAARGFADIDHPDLPTIETILDADAVDYFRFYAMTKVADSKRDFTLSVDGMQEFVNTTVVGRIGSFFTRSISLLGSLNVNRVPSIDPGFNRFETLIADLEASLLKLRSAEAVDLVQTYFDKAHSAIDDKELWNDPNQTDVAYLCWLVSHGLVLLEPIMPEKASSFDIFPKSRLKSIAAAKMIGGDPIDTDIQRWEYFDPS